MSTRFGPYHPEQSYLLPPSPSDWLAEGHLAYFIAEMVDTLEVDGFYAEHEGSKRKGMSYGRMLAEKKITAYVALGREGQRGKDILPSTKHTHTQAMQERMRSAEGQHWYGQRKWLAEPRFGWIKHVLGFRRFSLRGHQKVKAEWQLVCAALNLKRMAVLSTS